LSIALICTRGFADILPLARQNRVDPYTVHVPASPWLELLPHKCRIESVGRIDSQGIEVEPINTRQIIDNLRALTFPLESIAICLLFSPLNPSHEKEVARVLAIEFPQARVFCSYKIFPHLGEYERTLATVKSLGLEVPHQLTAESFGANKIADLFATKLEDIANRMQQQILDAAVSSVVREAMDCSAALFLPDGRMISQARTLPLLSGSLSPAVKGLLRVFPIEFMMEGDCYLVNDPWSGGTHLPDFVLMRPIFRSGEVQALAVCILHHQDVGGISPGSVPTHATSIHQEGIRIPPVRLFHRHISDENLMGLLCANSRMPENLRGDLRAQWLSLDCGVQDMQSIVALNDFNERCEAILLSSEAATRDALRNAPDGLYYFEDALDGDGIANELIPVVVQLRKSGDAITIDLTGCAPQTLGPINASRGAVWAAVSYFAQMLAPQASCNEGCTVPITLITRPSSIVDPTLPAALNARTNLIKLLANSFIGAWSLARPDHFPAPNAGEVVVLSLSGTRLDGTSWMFTEIIASAAGGAPWGPGGSGVSTDLGNTRNTPAEVIELQAPLRVERVAIRQGSGGAGRHKGGDGVIRAYRLMEGAGCISYRGERHSIAPQGGAGGQPGACASARIEQANGHIEVLPAKARATWRVGDLLVIETAGAGGWGAT
jgi:N-methylhydantoinase B